MSEAGVPSNVGSIPCQKFSTRSFRAEEQFSAWNEFTTRMCELRPQAPAEEGFRATGISYQFGSLQLTTFSIDPVRCDYTADNIRKLHIDHWCLGMRKRGRINYQARFDDVSLRRGDLLLYSYAAPFSAMLDGATYSNVFISRDEFWDIADKIDGAVHSPVKGALSQIVVDFITMVEERADEFTLDDAPAIQQTLSDLLRAMFKATPDAMEAAREPIAAVQLNRARRFIHDNLTSPDLSPDVICANIGVSRRQLFYLFERHGGVTAYIRGRRLAACLKALRETDEKKRISSVAFQHGFTSLSSFNRQFSARYGFAPSDARSAGQSSEIDRLLKQDHGFANWLLLAGRD